MTNPMTAHELDALVDELASRAEERARNGWLKSASVMRRAASQITALRGEVESWERVATHNGHVVDQARAERDGLLAALMVYAGPVDTLANETYPAWADGYPGGILLDDCGYLDMGEIARAAILAAGGGV